MPEMKDRLKQLRSARNWTQTEVARRLSLHKTHISKFERGTYLPSLPILMKLAKLYEVSTDYLLFGDEPEFDELAIISRVRLLSPEERKFLFAMLDGWVQSKK